jgi:large subunit ribosomal protein L10
LVEEESRVARPEKSAVVDEISAKLSEADAAVLTEYRGLTVGALAELRATLRPADAEYKVFKNTLARRGAEAAGLAELVPLLEGPVAIAFVRGDAVVAAKALRDFARNNPALIVKGGLLGENVLDAGAITALADVEPREVLLAKLAGGFQAPLVKAAGLFQAFTRNFAYGVKAYVDQRTECEGEALPADEPEAVDAPAPEPEPESSDSGGEAATAAAGEAGDVSADAPPAAADPEGTIQAATEA